MTLFQWLVYVAAVAGFWGVWYLVGAWAGILWTRRGLAAGVAVALCGVLGVRFAWALDAMLVADALLIAAVWLDAALRPGQARPDWASTATRPLRSPWVAPPRCPIVG